MLLRLNFPNVLCVLLLAERFQLKAEKIYQLSVEGVKVISSRIPVPATLATHWVFIFSV